jgi:hypothetical protein
MLLAVALAALAGGGCGKNRAPVYPVTGKVLVKGQPAEGAFLVFHPKEAGDKDTPRPYATTDADGSFKLTTFDTGDGAPAGDYRVTVVWRPKPKSTMEAEGPDRLGDRYGNAASSPIQATVGKGPTNLEPFKLDGPGTGR